MGFFEDISKKANDAYQVTKEKTIQITNEIKMKSKINNNNDQIQALYKELGIMTFDSYKSNTELSKEDIAPKCEEINSLLEDVAKMKIEILTLKKLKKCVSCEAEIDQDDKYCPKCGTEQPTIKKDEAEVKDATDDAEDIEIKVEEDKNDDE